MNKKTQLLLIAFIILMLILIITEYNNQFQSIYAALDQENEELQARIYVVQDKIDALNVQIAQVNALSNDQREITDRSNYQFYIENTELFEGIDHEN